MRSRHIFQQVLLGSRFRDCGASDLSFWGCQYLLCCCDCFCWSSWPLLLRFPSLTRSRLKASGQSTYKYECPVSRNLHINRSIFAEPQYATARQWLKSLGRRQLKRLRGPRAVAGSENWAVKTATIRIVVLVVAVVVVAVVAEIAAAVVVVVVASSCRHRRISNTLHSLMQLPQPVHGRSTMGFGISV